MADFWAGFGKGFAPAFESSYESAARKREKAADRLYAQEQLKKQLARVKAEKVAERVRKEFQTIRGLENLGVSSGIGESQDPSTQGPLQRAGVTDELDYLPASEREALAFSMPYKEKYERADKLKAEERKHAKSLLDAKYAREDFEKDFEATKARLQSKASSGVTKIPLGWLSPFREGQKKRLGIFFDTAVTDYNNASVEERDEAWKGSARVLAPYASTQYKYPRPDLPVGSKITEAEADELWNAHLFGEGKIVEARAGLKRTREKEWDAQDLADAKREVESGMEDKVREYVGLRGIDWNQYAQGIYDERMGSIRAPEEAWKVYGKMTQDVDNQRLLDSVKDSDFFAETARNLVKKFMADSSLRANPKAMDYLLKSISPEKTSAWRKQFAEWKTLRAKRDAAKSKEDKAKIQEEMNFIHRKANLSGEGSTHWQEVLHNIKLIMQMEDGAGGSGGGGSQPPQGVPAVPDDPVPELPALPSGGEMEGAVPPKAEEESGDKFPSNPKEGDKFGPVTQGGSEKFNFIFRGGKWIQVK